MAIYENKVTGELVQSYKFTGENRDFIKDKLLAECHFTEADAEFALSNMRTDDAIVVEYSGKEPNPEYWHITSGDNLLEIYEPFTIKG